MLVRIAELTIRRLAETLVVPPKQQHAFMGLLTCSECGCAITAPERRKGKYVYYHCTNFHGGCQNTYIREERLGELPGEANSAISISETVAAARRPGTT